MAENIHGSHMDTAEMGLKKHNLKVHTIVFMIFSLVAAGCYGIETMIPESGPGLTLVLLMALPFCWGIPFGLVASELGSVRPQEGGYYKWVQEAFGEFWGFMAGWWRTISVYIDNTIYVVLAGGYLATIIGRDETSFPIMAFKWAMILFFMWINLRGVRDVGIVTSMISIFTLCAFAMVAIVGFANVQGNPFDPFFSFEPEAAGDYFYFLGVGLSIGMWMYSGYESMSTFAGELEDPQVIPKATLISVPLIMATYILPTSGALAALNFTTEVDGEEVEMWELWGESGADVGYHTAPDLYLGPAFGIAFLAVAVIAQFSIYNTYITSGSRGFFALAEDKLAPPFMVRVGKKKGVPYIAVISVALVNMILCVLPFETIVIVDVFLLVSSYVMVYFACIVLRKRFDPSMYEGKFKIPGGYGFLVFICIMPVIVAFVSFFVNGTDYFIGGMIGIYSGPIMYFIWKHMYGGLAKKDPDKYKINKKTGLGVGDTFRMAKMFGLLAVIGTIGRFFLDWFEREDADEWYGAEVYVTDNGTPWPLLGNFDSMMTAITIVTIITYVVAIAMFVWGKAVEPKKGEQIA